MKNELVTLLCSRFYEPVSGVGCAEPIPGQIVSGHTVYPTIEPWILKVISYDAADPNRSQYEVKRFEPGDQSHFPIAELQLRTDENYYIYKGKERPLVIVGAIKLRWANPRYDESIFLCAPLFTFKPKHTDDFKIRCVGFCYPSLFYLPREPDGCSAEGVVRFEYIQPIARRALHNYFAGSPSHPIKLSNDAFALFVNHLGRFLFQRDFDSEVCSNIDAYHGLVTEELTRATTVEDDSSERPPTV